MPDVVPGAVQNESQPKVSHKHSNFPIEFNAFDTHQFGYVRPHLAVMGVPSDSLRHRPVINSRSYTLKAPLMQDVYRRLSYVKVNLDAILPLNAEKVYTNPVIGDDVVTDVNCCVDGGFKKIANAVQTVLTYALSDYNTNLNTPSLVALFKAFVFAELFYSRGSVLASLGCHLFSQLQFYPTGVQGADMAVDIDDLYDQFIIQFITGYNINGGFSCTIDGEFYFVSFSHTGDEAIQWAGQNVITMHEFICRIRSTSDWTINEDVTGDVSVFCPNLLILHTIADDVPFNFMRCAAYQLAIAEFMTNDKIDFIYSAELYRQNIGDLLSQYIITSAGNASWPQNFVYNGVSYQYDYLSGRYLDYVLNRITLYPSQLISPNAYCLAILQYFINLFGIRRSLRYKDYFVGARSNPLAVGDVNVSVNANLVNVVDITKKIQLQRFLNVVNHTGRRIGNYVKTLFGVDISSDRHVPQFLAELTEKVYTSEVENTGSDQLTKAQSVTAIFTSNSSNKELEFGIDLNCVIIGLTSYDIERAYIHSIDRDFFIKNRFDMFLPELQFVGDQAIYTQELNCNSGSPFGSAFAYQYRDMQWKQIYSRASGGFAGKLPGYAFIQTPNLIAQNNISPEFIRSLPSEIDNLYVSLTGYSLGNYFHFIVWTKNFIDASRPMVANPTILE